jgi:ribonuclease J
MNAPPNPDSNTLHAIPLGGLGEFGLNSMAFRCGDDAILVDCGLMVPDDEGLLGVDFVIPDFSYVFQEKLNVRGIFLTHAHEDHIGALPYLFPDAACPVHGTAFTLAMCRSRLREHGLLDTVEFQEVEPRQKIQLGPFEIEPIQVTHSISRAVAYAIRTPAGTVLHTGDYKIDQTPPDGRPFDWLRFGELGEEGVLALFGDSTNADAPGWTPSEQIIRNAPGRIFISCFSSAVHRIGLVLDIAKRYNRKVAFVGRSMNTNTRVMREMGEIEIDPRHELPAKELMQQPLRNQLYLTTGSQGEPMAALSRIALGEDRQVSAEEGDLVVMSTKMIPGNERRISTLISHFYKLGVRVITEKTMSDIHVSGHPCQEEMKALLTLVRPRYLVPIHGEFRLLSEHAEIARQVGLPDSRIMIVEDGEVVAFRDGEARVAGEVQAGRVLIDSGSLDQVEEIVIRDRQHISEDGIVIPVTALNAHDGHAEVEIITRGLLWVDEGEELLAKARDLVLNVLAEMSDEEQGDAAVVKTQVRRALRKFFRKETGKGPMIIPVVMEV